MPHQCISVINEADIETHHLYINILLNTNIIYIQFIMIYYIRLEWESDFAYLKSLKMNPAKKPNYRKKIRKNINNIFYQ